LASEDGPERFALSVIGALVQKQTKRHLSFAGPYISVEGLDADNIEAVKLYIAVRTFANMPS
jgi:hypothetical protein